MKNVILALLLALVSTTAFAADIDTDVTVGASSDYLYKGQSLTEGQPTVFGGVRIDNVAVDGLYFTADGAVTNLAPLNTRKTINSVVGLGYVFNIKRVALDVGAYRVFNPVIQPADYNEFRATATYAVTDNVSVYGRVSKVTSNAVPLDLYYAGGVEYRGLFTEKLSAGVMVAAINPEGDVGSLVNNTEVYASYDLGKGFEAFGTYSIGGRHIRDTFDSQFKIDAVDIPSVGLVGVRYTF